MFLVNDELICEQVNILGKCMNYVYGDYFFDYNVQGYQYISVGKFENKLRKFGLMSEMVSDIVLFDIVFDST